MKKEILQLVDNTRQAQPTTYLLTTAAYKVLTNKQRLRGLVGGVLHPQHPRKLLIQDVL